MGPGPSTSLLGFNGSLEKERYWAPPSRAGGLTEVPAVAMPNTDRQTDHSFSRGVSRGRHVSERQDCPPHFTTKVASIVIIYLKLQNPESISILPISFRMCDNLTGQFSTHIFFRRGAPERGRGFPKAMHLGLSLVLSPSGPPASLFHFDMAGVPTAGTGHGHGKAVPASEELVHGSQQVGSHSTLCHSGHERALHGSTEEGHRSTPWRR